MTFLNPTILFALIAASIPLIIHLFNLRRPKTVDFSSLAFLEELRQQTLRKLKLRQWLLLALRMLAIAFLVLAFARPTIQNEAVGRILGAGRTATVIVLDNSISMLQRDENGDYYSQARDELLSIASDLESGDELTIIPLISDRDAGSARLASPTLVRDWLEEVPVSAGAPRLPAAIGRALSVLEESNHPNRELFVVSDIQRTTFADSVDAELPSGVRMYLVPIGTTVQDNVAVTAVDVQSRILDQGQPVRLDVEISNFGSSDLANWSVSAYLGGDRVAQAAVDIPSGGTAHVDMTLTPSQRGWLPGYVEIEDDGFEADNRRHFTLHVPEMRRILVVTGNSTDTSFLELAMSRQLSRNGGVFTIETVDESEFSSTPISDYDAIVLHGLQRYSSGQITTIQNFVANGGGLFLFIGETGPAPDYDALLRAVGGGRVSGISDPATPGTAYSTLERVDPEHPIFLGVFEQAQLEAPDVGHPSFYKAVEYVSGPGDEHTIISSSTGGPVLQEIRGTGGRVLVSTWLAQPDWTDLPFRGVFVPLVYRALYYLTSAQGDSGEGFVAGSGSQYRLGSRQTVRVALRSEEGEEWIPDQRGGLQGMILTLPPSIRDPGVYAVTAGEEVLARLAINGDPAESDLRSLDPEAAARSFETVGSAEVVILSASSVASEGGLDEDDTGSTEIWNVFLALALVLLVVEMLVSKR